MQQPARSIASPDTANKQPVQAWWWLPTAMLKQILIPSLLMGHAVGRGMRRGLLVGQGTFQWKVLIWSILQCFTEQQTNRKESSSVSILDALDFCFYYLIHWTKSLVINLHQRKAKCQEAM